MTARELLERMFPGPPDADDLCGCSRYGFLREDADGRDMAILYSKDRGIHRIRLTTWDELSASQSDYLLRVIEVPDVLPPTHTALSTLGQVERLNEDALYQLQFVDGTPAPFPPMTRQEMMAQFFAEEEEDNGDASPCPSINCITTMGHLVDSDDINGSVLTFWDDDGLNRAGWWSWEDLGENDPDLLLRAVDVTSAPYVLK